MIKGVYSARQVLCMEQGQSLRKSQGADIPYNGMAYTGRLRPKRMTGADVRNIYKGGEAFC